MDVTLPWGLDVALGRLAQPWMLPIAAVLALVALGAGLRRGPVPSAAYLLVAQRLRGTRRWRTLVRRRRLVSSLGLLASLVVLAGAAWGAARPQGVVVETPVADGRDVVLCLDSSASMDRDNIEIVEAYSRLVDELDGDRVGIVMWSGAAVTLVPLTSDRDVIQAELRRFADAARGSTMADARYFAGTELLGLGASHIASGLVSCLDRLDPEDPDRGRAVVLASDNDPSGRDDYTLEEAAAIARDRGVVVHGIGASRLVKEQFAGPREELKTIVESTGGVFVVPGDDTAALASVDAGASIGDVVRGIDELEEARSRRAPQRYVGDDLDPARLLAGGGVLLLGLLWATSLWSSVTGRWRR